MITRTFFVSEDGEEFTDYEKALEHQGRLSHITDTYTVYDENHEIIPFKLKPTCYDKAAYIEVKDSGQIDEDAYFVWKLYGLKFPEGIGRYKIDYEKEEWIPETD